MSASNKPASPLCPYAGVHETYQNIKYYLPFKNEIEKVPSTRKKRSGLLSNQNIFFFFFFWVGG